MALLDDWDKETIDTQWIYTPKKLGTGKVYKIMIYRPEKLDDQDFRDWFAFKVANSSFGVHIHTELSCN